MEEEEFASVLWADEKLIWTGKPIGHPYIAGSMISIPIGLLLFTLPALMVFSQLERLSTLSLGLLLAIIAIGLVVAMVPPLIRALSFRNAAYALTNRRLIVKKGVIAPSYRSIQLGNLERVAVGVGYWDRRHRTGSIFLSTAGGRAFPRIASVENAQNLRRTILNAIHRAKAA